MLDAEGGKVKGWLEDVRVRAATRAAAWPGHARPEIIGDLSGDACSASAKGSMFAGIGARRIMGLLRQNQKRLSEQPDRGVESVMTASEQTLFADGLKGCVQRATGLCLYVAKAQSDYPPTARLRPSERAIQFARRIRWYAVAPFVVAYRLAILRRVIFIGVTGSTGKTTTKELAAKVLSSHLTGQVSQGTANRYRTIAKTILTVRPWHDFAVQEVSGAQAGVRAELELPLSLLMPRIGVVTNVGSDHVSAFGSKEAIAEEKGKLAAALPADGTAILNADDGTVRAMARRTRGQVILYGTSHDADLRAEAISSAWPDPLSFDLVYNGERYKVQTQLLGVEWVTSVLAAIAVGLAMGIRIPDALSAIAKAEPVESRMQPFTRPDGVTFIRDDIKASPESTRMALEFMRNARATRKIVVIGTLSDHTKSPEKSYPNVAAQALEVADLVVVLGKWAHKCLTVQQRHPKGHALYAVPSVEAGQDVLCKLFRPGDLVMVKANVRLDDTEALLSIPIASSEEPPPAQYASPEQRLTSREALHIRVVVGLGNPGARFEQTRHNVGFKALDLLADQLGSSWAETNDAAIATVKQEDRSVLLVKPKARMNRIGETLARIRSQIGFAPEECLLVFDDISMSVGKTRFRTHGGYGGHRGCRSVVESFATTMIPRVRIGVGSPENGVDAADYVLAEIPPEDRPAITAACHQAVDKILPLLGR